MLFSLHLLSLMDYSEECNSILRKTLSAFQLNTGPVLIHVVNAFGLIAH